MGIRLSHGRTPAFRVLAAPLPKPPVVLPYELRGEMDWHDFTRPSNPLGAPDGVVRAMQASLSDGELDFAPDTAGHELRRSLAGVMGVDEDAVLVGGSVTQLMRLAAQAFTPTKVAVCTPCPPSYLNAMALAGHTPVQVSNDVTFATPEAHDAHGQAGDFEAAVLGNPSFPASRLVAPRTVSHYLEECEWVMVDESYVELCYNGQSVVPLLDRFKNLVVFRSVSDTFGMPGVPIACMVAAPEVVSRVRRFFDGTSNTMFAEVVSSFARSEAAARYLERTHDLMESEIPWLHSMVSRVPQMRVYAPEGDFILCRFDPDPGMRLGVMDVSALMTRLQSKGFQAHCLAGWPGFRGRGYFCVSVRDRHENDLLVRAIHDVVLSCGDEGARL